LVSRNFLIACRGPPTAIGLREEWRIECSHTMLVEIWPAPNTHNGYGVAVGELEPIVHRKIPLALFIALLDNLTTNLETAISSRET
jgi:hypothetical protein